MVKKLTTALASLLLFISNSSIAQMPVTDEANNKQLAQEIAHCYMAHKMANSHDYVNYATNKYLATMVILTSEEKTNYFLNIAFRRYRNNSGYTFIESGRNAEMELQRNCPAVDKKIEKLLN